MNIYEEIVAIKNTGMQAVLATVIETVGSAPRKPCAKMLIKADGSIVGTVGGGSIEKKVIDEAMALMGGGEPKILRYDLEELGMTCGGSMGVFLEPLGNTSNLIIFGAGHIGSVLSKICKMLEFNITVLDNRPEFANKERLPWADKVIASDYHEALQKLAFSDNTYLVIVTHRHVHDVEILDHCSRQPFRYLGMIGSRKKVAESLQQLRDKGTDEVTLKRIHAPIGINIGGNTPAEIAVAIAAELVAVRSGTEI